MIQKAMSGSTNSFAIQWAVGVLAGLLVAGSVGAATDARLRSVDIVQNSDGGYTADVAMFAPVPVSVAWDVLTDFDRMADWVPNVRESKVITREGNAVTIEQRGVAKFGIASFPYVSVRQMQLAPQRTVRATQVKGNMRRLESLMTLTPERDGTQLTYHLEMMPAGLAAAALSRDFLAHELSEQFGAIMDEMVRRNR